MNKTLQKILIVLGVVAAIVVVCVLLSQREKTDFHEKYENADLTREIAGMERVGAYTGYLNSHADAAKPDGDVDVDVFNFTSEGDVHVEKAATNDGGDALFLGTALF